MRKEELRSQSLERRNALTKDQVEEYGQRIFDQVKPYIKHHMIAVYYPYGKEVRTDLIVKEVLQQDEVCMPITKGMGKMNFYSIDETTTYKKGIYGIQEPVSSNLVKPNEIDVIFIPLVAFDETRQRIGHGLAYYDRYLANCDHALKIGLAYECQKVEDVYADSHDIALDMIITEAKIYK